MRKHVLLLTLTAVLAVGVPVVAQESAPTVVYFRLGPALGSTVAYDVPADGSTWVELHPGFGVDHTQGCYEDGGDEVVGPGDLVTLGSVSYRIDWARPTYHLVSVDNSADRGRVIRLGARSGGADPTSERWRWICPRARHGKESQVAGWVDGGEPGVFGVGDNVCVSDQWWRVADIVFGVRACIDEPPVESTVWTEIKDFLESLLD